MFVEGKPRSEYMIGKKFILREGGNINLHVLCYLICVENRFVSQVTYTDYSFLILHTSQLPL